MSSNNQDLCAAGISIGGTVEKESLRTDSAPQDSDMEQGWPGEEEEKPLCHETKDKTLSQVDLVMLTMCMGGLQMAFSIQFVAGTKSLLALEIRPAIVGVIWMLPPACGALLQPCLGSWSDRCSSRWGPRKPFIVVGGIGLALSLLGFAWSPEVPRLLLRWMWPADAASAARLDSSPGPVPTIAKLLAVLSLLGINVSAQAVQVGARALVVDCCPSHVQPRANAWASRIIGLASILVYSASAADVSRLMPALGGGDSGQLKALSLMASLTLLATLGTTCLGTTCAAGPRTTSDNAGWTQQQPHPFNLLHLCRQIQVVMAELPSQIHRIHLAQCFSWLAWYPFLVYASSFVEASSTQDARPEEANASSRHGATALVSFSIGGLLTSSILPGVLVRLCQPIPSRHGQPTLYWGTYRNVWFLSQVIYCLALYGLLLSHSFVLTICCTSLAGFSWAVTQWIPMTMTNMCILGMEDHSRPGQDSEPSRAGAVLGIHNTFTAAPQMLSSVACSMAFKFVKRRAVQDESVYSMSWIFATCGMVSFTAAVLILRIADRHP